MHEVMHKFFKYSSESYKAQKEAVAAVPDRIFIQEK